MSAESGRETLMEDRKDGEVLQEGQQGSRSLSGGTKESGGVGCPSRWAKRSQEALLESRVG